MRRMIAEVRHLKAVNWCCPGHDDFPNETYNNNRSKRARSRDRKIENRTARRRLNRIEVEEEEEDG